MTILQNLTAFNVANCEEILILKIDGNTPLNRLIASMIENGNLPQKDRGEEYHIVKDTRQLDKSKTMKQAGFIDGDTLEIYLKSTA